MSRSCQGSLLTNKKGEVFESVCLSCQETKYTESYETKPEKEQQYKSCTAGDSCCSGATQVL